MKNKNNKKTEKFDVDNLLKKALSSTETPDKELVQKIKNYENYELVEGDTVLKKSNVIRRSFRFSVTAAIAITVMIISTVTAFTAWQLLKPSEVAEEFEDSALSAAFDSEDAVKIDASVTSGGYTITLLDIVSGKNISDYQSYADGKLREDRTYSVIAIQKEDISPMPSTADENYGNQSFYVSPYIKGLKPWIINAHTLHGGYSETVVDGVMYRLLECDEIMMFADRGVYIGISNGDFYNSQAFIIDEETGEMKANPDYDGMSAVFELPLDKSLADPEKAEEYLNSIDYYK